MEEEKLQNQDSQPREDGGEKVPQGLFSEPVASMQSEPEQGRSEAGVGIGRIIRLIVLLAVLGTAVVLVLGRDGDELEGNVPTANSPTESAPQELGAMEKGYLDGIRTDLEQGSLAQASAKIQAARDLMKTAAPRAELAKLIIAFDVAVFAKGRDQHLMQRNERRLQIDEGYLQDALVTFNALLLDEQNQPSDERWDALASGIPTTRMIDALADYPAFQEGARRHMLNVTDARFIEARVPIGRTARRMADPQGDPSVTAIRVATWMALHLAPPEPDAPTVSPGAVLSRWRADRKQAAWAYSEFCRQVGIGSMAFEMAGESLIVVYPAGADPFVVNPWMGVPLLDTESGKPVSFDDFKADPSAYLPGAPKGPTEPELYVAAHPRVFYDRIQVLTGLLKDMPVLVVCGLDVSKLPADAPIRIWPGVMEQITPANRQLNGWRRNRMRQLDSLLETGRSLQVLGGLPAAYATYGSAFRELTAALEVADVDEARETIVRALDAMEWQQASCLVDMGRFAEALATAEVYLEKHPEGEWRDSVRLLQAELLDAMGRADEAKAIWQDLPEWRRLYGSYRAAGLLRSPLPPKAITRSE